ncbi:SRPBCC family protein [Nocardiopsis nanhaiensis]
MSVTSVDKDFENRTLTLVCDLPASVERAWELWADPRQLERWWGPPTYPATMEKHELTPGGDVTYFMTSPEGDRHHCWWRIVAVEPPTTLEFLEGFGEEPGEPGGMPSVTIRLVISEHGDGARMVLRSTFTSFEAMEQMIEMGMDEGMSAAIGQIDELLAA